MIALAYIGGPPTVAPANARAYVEAAASSAPVARVALGIVDDWVAATAAELS